jgi:tetratricopeptide (TPR) repeat protein
MRRSVALAFTAATLLLSACVQTHAIPLSTGGPAPRARLKPAQVAVYRTAAQVPRKYVEVAMLNSSGESHWTSQPMMVESMKATAAKLGANAVILDDLKEASAGAKVAAAFLGTGSERQGRAVAVYVYPEGSEPPATAAAAPVTGPAPAALASTPPSAPVAVVPAAFVSPARETPPLAPAVEVTPGAASSAAVAVPTRVSNAARAAAATAFKDGKMQAGMIEYGKAEYRYREAIRLDPTVAAYHGALGSLMIAVHRYDDAVVAYSAALLLDVDNLDYREQLKYARARQ